MNKDPQLHDIWIQQQNYNEDIRKENLQTNSQWMQNYILGVVSELGELLEEIKWKQHRVQSASDFGHNTVDQLADITKYVISMWQVIGCTPQDLLHWTYDKGIILEQLRKQERKKSPTGRDIIMLDLDGTIADFRRGFLTWLEQSSWKNKLKIKNEYIGLHLDLDNGWTFRDYSLAKLEFESEGGYYGLFPIKVMKSTVNVLRSIGWYVIVYTARPYKEYKRIWGDTWRWLNYIGPPVDELHFGYDTRIIRAEELRQKNHVVALEDDPTLISRYLQSGVPVFMYPQPYNIQEIPISSLLSIVDPDEHDWEIVNRINHTSPSWAEKEQ